MVLCIIFSSVLMQHGVLASGNWITSGENLTLYTHAQSCLTLCGPMDGSPPGSSVLRILQARILEWVAMPSSRGSSRPRVEPSSPESPALAGGFFTTKPPGKLTMYTIVLHPVTRHCKYNSYATYTMLLTFDPGDSGDSHRVYVWEKAER